MELADDTKIDDAEMWRLFAIWWKKYPKKVKVKNAQKAWEKVIKKEMEVHPGDYIGFIQNRLIAGLDNQLTYRKRVYDSCPDPEVRRRKDIWLPSMPHPASWLNGGGWEDEVPQLPDERPAGRTARSCVKCDEEGEIIVGDNQYCSWHWVQRFDRKHLRVLYDNLISMGLERRKEESKMEWSDRCREHLRTTRWGASVGA